MSVSSAGNEPWQYEFENEEVNDERWSCLVSTFVESENDNEECFKLFYQKLTMDESPLIRVIRMADVTALFQPNKKAPKGKKTKSDKDIKISIKKKISDKDINDASPPIQAVTRYPEIIPFLSQFAIITDGICQLSPILMAYVIKWMILILKDENQHQRRIDRMANREAMILERKKMEKFISMDESWNREMFDIFGEPLKDGPFQSPELYIVLYDFYDPFIFQELIKLKVPFHGVIRIENASIPGGRSSKTNLKKSEMVDKFWKSLEGPVSNDIALIKFTPQIPQDADIKNVSLMIVSDFVALLYSIYNLVRLHQTYLQQMTVHRMIESLELLDLSKCMVYNELCDALIMEDSNAEIFVLYSMIEQVVAGVPETESRILNYNKKSSSFFQEKEDIIDEEKFILKDEEKKFVNNCIGKNDVICFYDDKISFTTMMINSNILTTNEIFDRFIIKSVILKIRNKFIKLSPALKAQNDFNFYQLWQIRKENMDIYKVKVFLLFAKKLMEKNKIFEFRFENNSHSGTSHQNSIEKSESDSELINEVIEKSKNLYFIDLHNLFYKSLGKGFSDNEKVDDVDGDDDDDDDVDVDVGDGDGDDSITDSSFRMIVRKVKATAGLRDGSSLSSVDSNMACGKCPKFKIREKLKNDRGHLKRSNSFLESYDITQLIETTFLSNLNNNESFVEKYGFYETFEPNRTAQRLQELFNNYNTIEYNYFPPTDTLFVLGYNDSDFRGIHHTCEKGFLNTPLCLRDFVRYILPDNRKWMMKINERYINFLKGIWMRRLNEEKRRNHEISCRLLKRMNEFTGDIKNESNEEDGEMMKERQELPEKEFFGINMGGENRIQVNVVNYEFLSDDFCKIKVKTQSWLDGDKVVTLTAERNDCQVIVHRWMKDVENRMMIFREPSGIMINFDVNNYPFPVRIRQPNGLLVEVDNPESHIKQMYFEKYKWGDDIAREKCRCYLINGSILKFYIDDSVEVLQPSGTKHICYKLSCGGDDVEIYETITSTGELWVRDDCSKCKYPGKSMMMMIGVDGVTGETYYKREDGTSCMLWPDGKLVTIYPDGTKITTTPEEMDDDDDDGDFIIITCSYVIEHPKFATVYVTSPKIEIRFLGKLKINYNSNELLQIECNHSVFKVSHDRADFFSSCKKRSLDRIFLNSKNSLAETYQDGKLFKVYCSGQILHKSYNFIFDDMEEYNEIHCEVHKNRNHRRCLIIERDLNGLEFLHENIIGCYFGNLSDDAFYDIGKISRDKSHLQHGFYDPIYRIGREKYLMNYERDDGYSMRITRKNMNGNNYFGNLIKKNKKREIPKMICVRFIRYFQPDPKTVIRNIMKDISVYQKLSVKLTKNFARSNKVKERPFARYIAKELEIIASQLCPSLQQYHHTCTSLPYTEMDIHSTMHRYDRGNYFVENNPADCQVAILPRCKRILKPLKNSGKLAKIPENDDNFDKKLE